MHNLNESTDPFQKDNNHLALFKFLIEQSNDAIFIASPQTGQLFYCNQKACQNLGYKSEELLNKRVFDYAQNIETLDDWEAMVIQLESIDNLIFETEQRRKDGSTLPVEVNVRLVRHPERSYIVSIARDITRRKHSEALLVSEMSKVEAFMKALDDKITVQDPNLKIIYQNQAHEKMQGSHIGEFCYKAYHGKDEACDGCLVLKSLDDGKIHRREASALTEKGQVHMEVISCPVTDFEGKIIAAVEIVRDITKHKEAEEVLRNTAQVRKQFISLAAHELGTPLSAIMGFSELLKNPEEFGSFNDKQQNEFIDIIHTKASALTDIVNNLLDISRIDTGQLPPMEKSLNDFRLAINKTISNFANLFQKHCFEVKFPEEGLKPLWIDQAKMIQVLENLLTNAVKYSPDGGLIRLSVDEAEQHYLFTLSDNGIGMTSDQMERIFEPFYRATADNPEIGGLGLGMSIVKQIVEGHQGTVRVESNTPKGLKVLFTLPRAKQES